MRHVIKVSGYDQKMNYKLNENFLLIHCDGVQNAYSCEYFII